MITCEGIIYIIAISLQLAGAELLIMNYWSKPFKKLKDEELNKETHVDEEMVLLGSRSEQEISSNIWLNRFAFVYIAVGYVVGIFSDIQDCSKWLIAVCVIVVSVIIAKNTDLAAKKINKD